MITNNIYLEAIPKTTDINYEILINGKNADSDVKNFNETDDASLLSQFDEYVKTCDNIDNSSVTENVTSSQLYKNDTTSYFVVDVKSVSNNKVTTYVKKYYTVMMGKSITYTIQSNGSEISDLINLYKVKGILKKALTFAGTSLIIASTFNTAVYAAD